MLFRISNLVMVFHCPLPRYCMKASPLSQTNLVSSKMANRPRGRRGCALSSAYTSFLQQCALSLPTGEVLHILRIIAIQGNLTLIIDGPFARLVKTGSFFCGSARVHIIVCRVPSTVSPGRLALGRQHGKQVSFCCAGSGFRLGLGRSSA